MKTEDMKNNKLRKSQLRAGIAGFFSALCMLCFVVTALVMIWNPTVFLFKLLETEAILTIVWLFLLKWLMRLYERDLEEIGEGKVE
jgi:hypothetical protein